MTYTRLQRSASRQEAMRGLIHPKSCPSRSEKVQHASHLFPPPSVSNNSVPILGMLSIPLSYWYAYDILHIAHGNTEAET